MSNETKKRSALVEILERHERLESDRKAAAWQAELDRRRERKRIGGQLTGLKQALKRARKRVRIFDAAVDLIKAGVPDRGLSKKIAKTTKLPTEYVRKALRDVDKE